MNPILGCVLTGLLWLLGWKIYGWPGVAMAASVTVFWLLLQFNRAVRVMKNASQSPIGRVDSAVMLNAKLQAGMTMMRVVTLTHSLGEKVADEPETWVWRDGSDSVVTVVLKRGRVVRWGLERPHSEEPNEAPAMPQESRTTGEPPALAG